MSALTEVSDVWVDLKEVQRVAVREDIEERERAAGLEDIHSHGVDRVVLHPSVASDPCIKKILAQDAAIRRHLEAADNASELGLVYTTSTMDPPERVLRCGSTGTVIVDEDEPPSMWAQLIPEDPHPICRTDSEIAGLPDDPEAVIEEPMEAEPTPSVGGPHEHTGTTEVNDGEVGGPIEGPAESRLEIRTLPNGSIEIIGERNWAEFRKVLEDVQKRFEGVIYAIWNGRNPPNNFVDGPTQEEDAAPVTPAAAPVHGGSQDGAPVADPSNVQADEATTAYCDTQERMLRGVHTGDDLNTLLVYPSSGVNRVHIWREGILPATDEDCRSIVDAISDNESVIGQDYPALHSEAGDVEVREDQDDELEYLDMDTNEDDLESSRSSVPPVIVWCPDHERIRPCPGCGDGDAF